MKAASNLALAIVFLIKGVQPMSPNIMPMQSAAQGVQNILGLFSVRIFADLISERMSVTTCTTLFSPTSSIQESTSSKIDDSKSLSDGRRTERRTLPASNGLPCLKPKIHYHHTQC